MSGSVFRLAEVHGKRLENLKLKTGWLVFNGMVESILDIARRV